MITHFGIRPKHLSEPCTIERDTSRRPIQLDGPPIRGEPVRVHDSFSRDLVDRWRDDAGSHRRVVYVHAQTHDGMERESRWRYPERKHRFGRPQPLDDVIDVENQFAGPVLAFDDLQTMNVVVMPRQIREVGLAPRPALAHSPLRFTTSAEHRG
jgi:hypothetical protein